MMETQNYWEDTSSHAMQVKYESLDGRSCKDEIYRMGIGAGYCEGNLNFATASEDDEVYTKKKVSRLFAMQQNSPADEKDSLSIEDIRNIVAKRYMNKAIYGTNLNKFGMYRCLRFINISNSKIDALPKNFGTFFKLEELDVSNNSLGTYDNYNWSWLEQTGIKNGLLALNLSKNLLTRLPIQVTKLNILMTLKIAHNKLTYLPQSIKNLKHLVILDISYNDLSYLPLTICKLHVYFADISNNSFSNNQIYVRNLQMPSLVELSANIVIDLGMTYDASVIPYTLIRYLDHTKYCCNCGNSCIDRYIRQITDRIPYGVVATYIFKTTETVQFECYYCSLNCCNQYQDLFNRLQNRIIIERCD